MGLATRSTFKKQLPSPGSGRRELDSSVFARAPQAAQAVTIRSEFGRFADPQRFWAFQNHRGLYMGVSPLQMRRPCHRVRGRGRQIRRFPTWEAWASPDRELEVAPTPNFASFRQSKPRDASEKGKTATKRGLRRRTRHPRPMGAVDKRYWAWVGRQASLGNATAPRL